MYLMTQLTLAQNLNEDNMTESGSPNTGIGPRRSMLKSERANKGLNLLSLSWAPKPPLWSQHSLRAGNPRLQSPVEVIID